LNVENLKAYIESGVLELYVLGDLSPEETAQVEEMASRYTEVGDEIAAIEVAMEQYAMQNAVAPSAEIEHRLFEQLGINPNEEIKTVGAQPVFEEEPRIVRLDSSDGKIRTLRYALVACIALLVVSTISLFITYNKLTDAHTQIASLNLDKEKFAANASFLEENNNTLKNIVGMSDSPEWATVKLAGTKLAPDAKMMLYWNKKDKKVMVNNVSMSLPENDTAHSYQLWALVNGKPVDLGVFNAGKDSTQMLLNMKTIEGAQAFAVTLEKRGGSISPTLEKMVVMGGV